MIAGQTRRSASHDAGRSKPHFIYRCFDADGLLLYVGCTKDVPRRISLHQRDLRNKASRWLQVSMVRYEVEGPYADLETARRVEANAIANEQPLFNRQDRRIPGWMLNGPIAQYLVEAGHQELALETACGCWEETRASGEIDTWCRAHATRDAAA